MRKFKGILDRLHCLPTCFCTPLLVSLLQVSGEISREVSKILYSENSFTVGGSDNWGLRPLKQLSPFALSNLQSLTLRLNTCEFIYGKTMYSGKFQDIRHLQGPEPHALFSCHPRCRVSAFYDKPLLYGSKQSASILQDLDTVVQKIAAYATLESLHLYLLCDTTDLRSAERVMNYLLPLSGLVSCSIRLSKD